MRASSLTQTPPPTPCTITSGRSKIWARRLARWPGSTRKSWFSSSVNRSHKGDSPVPDEVSLLNLADDFEEARRCPEAAPWNLRMGTGLEVFSTMRSGKFPADEFQARLCWSTYPGDPPSLKF